jgi:magnesium transporter
MSFWKRKKQRVPKIKRRAPVGSPPGLVVVDPQAPVSQVIVTTYTADGVNERCVADLNEIRKLLEGPGVVWVNVDGLGSESVLRGLAEIFHLHPLALEDVVNVHQRAKVDRYDNQLFITARIPADKERTEQLSLFLGRNYVLTFVEDPGDCFDPVRRRLRSQDGLMRRRGADYLAYALLDASVDAYFPLLEVFGERLEELEDEVIARPTPLVVAKIHDVKHVLRALRRVIWPLREAMTELARDTSTFVSDETRVYFRDLYDHAIQIMDLVETYREMGSDLTDLYLSSLSNRMNEIMRVLTVISTIFMPLSFIVGVYGMNFDGAASPEFNMPELRWKYGYLGVLALLGATAGGMLWFFWRRGWLGRPPSLEELLKQAENEKNGGEEPQRRNSG